jgi:hypothetical protein
MKYPCDCEDMRFIIDNYDKFQYQEGHWLDVWKNLDKTEKGTNIETFGVKFYYCEFCGKKIKG